MEISTRQVDSAVDRLRFERMIYKEFYGQVISKTGNSVCKLVWVKIFEPVIRRISYQVRDPIINRIYAMEE